MRGTRARVSRGERGEGGGEGETRFFRRTKKGGKLTKRRQARPELLPSSAAARAAPVAEQRVESYSRQHPKLREEHQVRDDDGDLSREARREQHAELVFDGSQSIDGEEETTSLFACVLVIVRVPSAAREGPRTQGHS